MHGHAMTIQAPALHRALAVLAPPKRFQLMLLLLAGPDRSVSQLARAVRLTYLDDQGKPVRWIFPVMMTVLAP